MKTLKLFWCDAPSTSMPLLFESGSNIGDRGYRLWDWGSLRTVLFEGIDIRITVPTYEEAQWLKQQGLLKGEQ